jgi:hypothetical protein
MFKNLAVFALAVAVTVLPASAAQRHHTTSSHDDATGCDKNNMTFDDLQTFVAQEDFAVPMSAAPFRVTAAHNGGISLLQGTGNEYQVTVCKYVGASDKAAADQVLGQIGADRSSDKLLVHGPNSKEDRWSAMLIIRVPQGANLSAEAHNGPLSAKNISGIFELRSTNGPISVDGVTGKVNASAQNGPISFSGNGGDLNLKTQNGPISINLEKQNWDNGTLEAHAENGPVSIGIPRGYQSGVVVTSTGHAPMSCSADVCSQARKTWDDDEKRIEFGSSNPVIHISTVNGPVSVGAEGSEGEL